MYTIGLPVAACSAPNRLMISVPDAVQLPSTPGTPVRLTNSSITSLGNPSGYVGNATLVSIPTISQCPTVVSFPSESSAHLPYAAVGASVVSSAFMPSIFPSPILIKLGILSPLLYSHTCASVCVPTSPNLAASGCSPIPTLSNIIHITLFIKSNPFLVERRSAISDIFLSYCTAHYYVYYTLIFYFIQSYNTRIVGAVRSNSIS